MAYEKRDAAFHAWAKREYPRVYNNNRIGGWAMDMHMLYRSFCAGWEKRKLASYQLTPTITRTAGESAGHPQK